jgi:hypothetical protein
VAELIRTAWRFVPRGKNSVAPSGYPSAAGKVMSSMKTSSSAASANPHFLFRFRKFDTKCEFGFCRKGLSRQMENQLAVLQQPVYNPALRCLP